MAFYKWVNGALAWAAGNTLTSSDLNNSIDQTAVPIGGVIAWAKSLTGVPALRSGWVECNGQVLSDADSPLNGQTIPNLNASGGGTKRFLRGSTTSGTTGGSETHTHAVALTVADTDRTGADSVHYGTNTSTSATDATSTLPSYYEVVHIMRIK